MALSSQLMGIVLINLLSFLLFSLLPILSHLLSCGRPVVRTPNTHSIHTIPATPPYILPLPLLPDWPGNLSRQPITVCTILIHSNTAICFWYFSWTFFNTMFPQNIRLQLTMDAASYSRIKKPSVVIKTHSLHRMINMLMILFRINIFSCLFPATFCQSPKWSHTCFMTSNKPNNPFLLHLTKPDSSPHPWRDRRCYSFCKERVFYVKIKPKITKPARV